MFAKRNILFCRQLSLIVLCTDSSLARNYGTLIALKLRSSFEKSRRNIASFVNMDLDFTHYGIKLLISYDCLALTEIPYSLSRVFSLWSLTPKMYIYQQESDLYVDVFPWQNFFGDHSETTFIGNRALLKMAETISDPDENIRWALQLKCMIFLTLDITLL